MGGILCPMNGKPPESDEMRIGDSRAGRDAAKATEAAAASAAGGAAPPPDTTAWATTDSQGCDPEKLVIAAIQAFAPAALRRYLQRRAQVTGFQCFDYTQHPEGGFRINVPSHALTIDTEMNEKWKGLIAEKDLPQQSVVLIKVIGLCALSTVEAGDGDKTKLRIVKQIEVEED